MGTVRWDAAKYGRNRGMGAGTVVGEYQSGGAHTSSASASNLTDGDAGAGSEVTFPIGVIVNIMTDTNLRVSFGGVAATASSGFFVPADANRSFEVSTGGTISVIDEA